MKYIFLYILLIIILILILKRKRKKEDYTEFKNASVLNNTNEICFYNNYTDDSQNIIHYPNDKYIKDIYDDLTNDNRLELQQNLDNLDANDIRNDYIIGTKYGNTKFDTY